jgi:hypothetical protein
MRRRARRSGELWRLRQELQPGADMRERKLSVSAAPGRRTDAGVCHEG